jgi:hypothetical protein
MKYKSAGSMSGSIVAVRSAMPEYTYIAAKDGNVIIFPNPASDKIYLKADANTTYTIELTNMIGAVVLSEEIGTGGVSIADLEPGIYIMRVYGADGTIYLSSKLIKR